MTRRTSIARSALNILTVVSLLLFLATTALWLHGHFVQEVISVGVGNDRLIRLHIKENGVVITSITGWPRREPVSWRSSRTGQQGYGIPVMFDGKTMSSKEIVPGVSYGSGTGTVYDPALPGAAATVVRGKYVVIVWLWLLGLTLALAGPFTAMAVRRWVVRRSRRAKGLCLSCGYDLRASPDRCPECGTVVEEAERAARGSTPGEAAGE